MSIGSRTIGLALAVLMGVGVAQAAEKAAPPAVAKEFKTFIEKFRAAVKADDAAAVAALTVLPFQGEASIATAKQFAANTYKSQFTKKNRACLQKEKAVYDRDDLGHDNYFIFCGDTIFVFTKGADGFRFTDIGEND